MIKYNYYLTTFKEIFNDVIEERRRIVHEERSRQSSYDRPKMKSREIPIRLNPTDLHKSASQNMLSSRFGAPMSSKGSRK